MINSIGNSVLAENEKGFGKLFDEVYISSKQRSSFRRWRSDVNREKAGDIAEQVA